MKNSFELKETKMQFKNFYKKNLPKNGVKKKNNYPSLLFDLLLEDSFIIKDEYITEIMDDNKKTILFFGPSLVFFFFFQFFFFFF
jgi:hypothetical protein